MGVTRAIRTMRAESESQSGRRFTAQDAIYEEHWLKMKIVISASIAPSIASDCKNCINFLPCLLSIRVRSRLSRKDLLAEIDITLDLRCELTEKYIDIFAWEGHYFTGCSSAVS